MYNVHAVLHNRRQQKILMAGAWSEMKPDFEFLTQETVMVVGLTPLGERYHGSIWSTVALRKVTVINGAMDHERRELNQGTAFLENASASG
jgi:hypothetical protein